MVIEIDTTKERKEVQKILLKIFEFEWHRKGHLYHLFKDATEEEKQRTDNFIRAYLLGHLPRKDNIYFKQWLKRHKIIFETNTRFWGCISKDIDSLKIYYSCDKVLDYYVISYPKILDLVREKDKLATRILKILNLGYNVCTYEYAKLFYKIKNPNELGKIWFTFKRNKEKYFIFDHKTRKEELIEAIDLFLKWKQNNNEINIIYYLDAEKQKKLL